MSVSNPGISLALKFALRELRGGLKGFYVFLACIALGVAAISGVNAVALSITGGIVEEGRTLLGGDIAVRTTQRRLNEEERAFISSKGKFSEAANMRAMGRLPDGSDQGLIELKAVDAIWPQIGSFETEPASAATAVRSGANLVVDPLLLSRLNLNVGDDLSVGKARLKIVGTIANEPDRVSDNFAIGPKVIMSVDSLEKTGLVQPGTIVNWTVRVVLGQSDPVTIRKVIREARKTFPEAGWRIRSSSNAAPALTRNIKRFSQFLTLVGLTALIVGGVGVANAVRAFLETKQHVIASFKSLGAPAGFVFLVYLLQILMLASIGIGLGLLLGTLMPLFARTSLQGIIPIGSDAGFQLSALLSAAAFGYLTALAFALWPLGQARDIPATALFRNAARDNPPWPPLSIIISTLLVIGVLVLLAISQSADQRIAATFIAGIGFSFLLLRMVARLIQAIAKKAPKVRSTPLRLAIGNIHRPGALTPSVVLSLGLGLALLVSLALIDSNLRRQISSNIPQNAPDFFFVDVQSHEHDAFKKAMIDIAPDGEVQTVPMLRGRIVSINDVPASKIKAKESGRWVLRGDRGITYAATLPENSSLSEGKWWDENHSAENLVSFAAEEAEEIGVNIGDKITVNVLGRNLTATVANLRNVEWQSMRINFVMVFSPNTFAGAPHAHMATLRAQKLASDADTTARDGDILRKVTNAFPTVTTVRVRDALDTVNTLIGQLATAIRTAAFLALAASVLVLAGALAAGNRARIHDAIVLKTLGATRRTLIGSFVLEYTLLGLVTAIFALIAGGLASWFVIVQIMGFGFTFQGEIALFTVGLALICTIGFGLIGTWRVLGQKAAPVLREL